MVTKHVAPTDEEIARKAYEISESTESGSDDENWHRAEQTLRVERASSPAAPKRRRAAAEPEAETATRARKSKPAGEKPGGKKK